MSVDGNFFLDSDWFTSGILAWVYFCLTFGTAIWKPCGSRNCGRACSLSKWQFWETILSQSVVASELPVTGFFTENLLLKPQNRRFSVKNPVTGSSEAKWGHTTKHVFDWRYSLLGRTLGVDLDAPEISGASTASLTLMGHVCLGACLLEIQTYNKKRSWTTPARLVLYIQQ